MASPTPVARILPTAHKLENGYQALLVLGDDTDAAYYEIAVGLPGLDSGDPVDTTTQLNVTYRTRAPRALIDLTPFPVTAAYAASAWTTLHALVGIPQVITIVLADTSTLTFYGFIQSVEFDPQENGTMPTMTITIAPTNYDPDNCVEAAPVLTDNGTC